MSQVTLRALQSIQQHNLLSSDPQFEWGRRNTPLKNKRSREQNGRSWYVSVFSYTETTSCQSAKWVEGFDASELLTDSITLQSYKICHYQPVLLDKMVLYVVSESSFLWPIFMSIIRWRPRVSEVIIASVKEEVRMKYKSNRVHQTNQILFSGLAVHIFNRQSKLMIKMNFGKKHLNLFLLLYICLIWCLTASRTTLCMSKKLLTL